MRPEFAKSVVINTEKYHFSVDKQPFPWFISEEGPKVRQLADNLYEVRVTVFAHMGFQHDAWKDGGRTPQPVIGGREFPWYITSDGISYRHAHGEMPEVQLAFFAREVEGVEIEDARQSGELWSWDGDCVKRADVPRVTVVTGCR